MKINKKSWHYWLNSKFCEFMIHRLNYAEDWRNKVTICEYFWKTVVAVLIASITVIGFLCGGLVALILGSVIFHSFAALITLLIGVEYSWINYGCFESLPLWLGLSLIVGFIAWFSERIEGIPDYMRFKPSAKKVESKPSLVGEYYRAYKSKFCTYVEVE